MVASVSALQNRAGIFRSVVVMVSLAYVMLSSHPVWGAVDVLIGRFDPSGTGTNLRETILDTNNVNKIQFGKLFSYEVEGFVYAQPLIVSNVALRDRVRNVLYVATTNNVVYALDADDPGPEGGLLWQVRLGDHGAFPVPGTVDVVPFDPKHLPADQTVRGNMGILSTPAIDRNRGVIYILSRTIETSGYVQRLHALDLLTGQEKPGSPTDPISASLSGVSFDSKSEGNRAGLTLSQSKVIIAWGAIPKDPNPNRIWHGWVMAYDADTLQRSGVFCTTCGAHQAGGGIWQSGRPPVVDRRGNVYFFVGNGYANGDPSSGFVRSCVEGQAKPPAYYAGSLIKLDPANLALVGSLTMQNWCNLDQRDWDLGGSGPTLVEGDGTVLAVGGGKEGRLYSIDTGALRPNLLTAEETPGGILSEVGDTGGTNPIGQTFCVVDSAITSELCPGEPEHPPDHHIMGGPVYWARSPQAGGSLLYVSLENDFIHSFDVINGHINPINATKTSTSFVGHPGAIMSLSANGEQVKSGILWINYASKNKVDGHMGAEFSTVRGSLAAYDASNLSHELWNSDLVDRDSLGYFAKFNPPTIANGKVYVAAFPNPELYIRVESKDQNGQPITQAYHAPNNMGYIAIYGLNPPAEPPTKSFVADILPGILAPLSNTGRLP
jgi:hypothetical protein